MIHTRFFAVPVAVLLGFLAAAPAAGAQTRQARAQSPSPATAQPPAVEAQTPPSPPALSQNAKETRQQFYRVLDQYPPALGRVLRLDPTLMTNQAYLASYPNVATFVAQYPDIPRNPSFYLERYDANYNYPEPPDARREALGMWRNAIEFLGALTIFCVAVFAIFSVVKYLVEYRRWHRISKVNAEVHNKILDRFGSNEELLAYIDSPAGRRFLEATPITPGASAPTRVSAPFGRILFSVQLGVLLVALAVGLMLVAGRAIDEVQQLLNGLAILGLCLGVGCVASAGASYLLSRKLGLLHEAAATPPTQPL